MALAASPAPGAPTPVSLRFPLYDPASGLTQTPGYAARKLEIQMSPRAGALDRQRLRATARTGRAGVDAVLDRFHVVALEPEFPAARAPEPGSGRVDLTGYYIAHLADAGSLAEALGALRAEPEVASASPIAVLPVASTPNDSLFSFQYGFSQASDRDSDFPEAWDLTQGDTSIVLAIVDTGVLWSHPDLAANIWINRGEIPGNGVDDDANGFIDDVRGWDFVTGVSGAGGEDLSTPDNDPSDFQGHGTAVAGVAGAVTDNTSGVAGAGYRCRIMALRAGWQSAQGGGVVDMQFCAQAIQYATEKGASVINCSWQNQDLSGLGAAVSDAIAAGITVVVAAGNEGTSTPPANDLGQRGDCVDVAALDADDVRVTSSNFGSWVDVSAAGNLVTTTNSLAYAPSYTAISGTSFAAPLVAGAVGLYQSWRRAHGLGAAPPDSIRWRLHDTADAVDSVNPVYAGELGGGRLNAWRMITDPPTSFFVDDSSPVVVSPTLVAWGSGPETIVYGDATGFMTAIDGASGAVRTGWPVLLGGAVTSDPAVWDVDFDGAPEVLVGSGDGMLHALESDGSEAIGWPKSFGAAITFGPALGNVAGTPAFELVFTTNAVMGLHVVDRSGAEMPGWPKAKRVVAAPALADLDGNGRAEIVVGGLDSTITIYDGAGNLWSGWPVKLGAAPSCTPAIGDFDGDGLPDIVVGALDGKVYAFSSGGVMIPGFPVATGAPVRAGVALADIDADGQFEALAGNADGKLFAWNGNGTVVTPGWPVTLAGEVRGSPVIADVTGDGAVDVAATDFSGSAYLFRGNGSPVPGWPRSTGTPALGGPTLADPDHDGRAEYLAGGEGLWCWDLGAQTYDATKRPWYTAKRSFLRQSTVQLPSIGVDPTPARPRGLALAAAAQPSRLGSGVRLVVRGRPGAAVEVGLFDPAGRRLATSRVTLGSDGVGRWSPDARALSAGVYFATARDGAELATSKIVLVP